MANQLLSTVAHRETLPEGYVRPESDRPRLAEVANDSKIPLIDLASPDKQRVIEEIAQACRTYGFFQVINHGIAEELLEKVMAVGLEFFRLPPEEKAKLYSDEPSKKIRLSTSFNVRKETVHNWRDYLRLHCYPLEEFVPEWPSNPESFKEIISTYCREVRLLGLRLLGAISLSLSLEEDYIEKVLGEQEQHMAVNYYPRCPEPDLTYGLPKHTDPNALTILLQDRNVAGLQVLKDGNQWIAVNPRANALVINLGDQLQALSNGAYKSVWHRAVVNAAQERMSVASFLCPYNSAVISPAAKLVGDGDAPVYRSYTYDEYYKKFWSRNLDQEHCLELFREAHSRSNVWYQSSSEPMSIVAHNEESKESGGMPFHYPHLTATNCTSWAIRVEAMMDAQGVWEAIEPVAGATVDVKKDNMARAHLLQALPEDLLMQVTKKKTTKVKVHPGPLMILVINDNKIK